MLTAEELSTLPRDPIHAFVEFERAARERMERLSKGDNSDRYEREYVASVLAFIHELRLDIPVSDQIPIDSAEFWDFFAEFKQTVYYHSSRYSIRQNWYEQGGVSSTVHLSDEFRPRIHELLGSIRKIVSAADLSSRKRDAIFNKINALAAEVDRSTTRLDAFTSMVLDVAHAIREGNETLEPVWKRFEKLAEIFGYVREKNASGELPAPPERKLLTGPKPNSSRPPADLDDDIPF
jgi:hypothetical protein